MTSFRLKLIVLIVISQSTGDWDGFLQTHRDIIIYNSQFVIWWLFLATSFNYLVTVMRLDEQLFAVVFNERSN